MLLMFIMSMLSGCVTAHTLVKVDGFKAEKSTLVDVKKAYVGTDDRLYICLQTMAFGETKEHWYGANLHAKDKQPSIQAAYIDAYACADDPFPIRDTILLSKVNKLPKAKYSPVGDVALHLSKRGDSPVLYQVKLTPWREERLFFTEQPSGDAEIITRVIDVRYQVERKREPNPLWYILVPPAVVVDVILSPLYLICLIVIIDRLPGDLH